MRQQGKRSLAAMFISRKSSQGAVSNNYGFYSVSAPPGTYTVIFSYVGYTSLVQQIDLSSNVSFNAELLPSTELKEVHVTSDRKDANVKNTEMGTVSLSIERIKTLPVLFGEVDILKTLQLLPGVQSAGEGNSGFYVRGGGPTKT